MAPELTSLRKEKLAWNVAVVGFLCLALWPLWSARFPPMQDYPQTLFHAHVLLVHDDPAFDYNRYYDSGLRPIYATFFLTTLFFGKIVPIEVAGKLSLSLYPVLIAILVLRLGRRFGKNMAPWGALLFFPLAFNQLYFLGILNFLLSLPILILALLDFEDLMKGELKAWPVLRQCLWQVALFITHPLSFFAYIGMALVGAILTQRRSTQFWVKVSIAIGMALFLVVAAWLENKNVAAPVSSGTRPIWLPLQLTMGFFALMFNDMRRGFGGAPGFLAALLWTGVFSIILGTLWFNWKKRTPDSLPARYLIFLIIALSGMFLLPFRVGPFTYINVRLAPVVYFSLALLVTQVRFRAWMGYCLAGLLALCMVQSLAKQARLSAEVNEIAPIINQIPPNSRILPLIFDRGSPELNRMWFSPHLHDHNYYHIVVGGGFDPYLLWVGLHPVHFKPGEERPAPDEYRADGFSWRAHSADYQYFLARGAPKLLADYMARPCNKLIVSGSWMLFARKPPESGVK